MKTTIPHLLTGQKVYNRFAMNSDCIYNYTRECLCEIERHFEDSSRHGGIDSIHDLRVAIKRLRALSRLIAIVNDNFRANECYSLVRPLFKAAGKVRDYQVQMQIIYKAVQEHSLELSEYYCFLKNKESKYKNDYMKFCESFERETLEKAWKTLYGALRFLEPDYIAERLEFALRKGLREIVALKDRIASDAVDYHQIRIGTKASRYTLEVARKCLPDNAQYSDLNDALKAVHQVLGVWHDKEIGLVFLEKYLGGKAPNDFYDKDSYNKYKNILFNQKSENLALFESRWSHFRKLLDIYGFLKTT